MIMQNISILTYQKFKISCFLSRCQSTYLTRPPQGLCEGCVVKQFEHWTPNTRVPGSNPRAAGTLYPWAKYFNCSVVQKVTLSCWSRVLEEKYLVQCHRLFEKSTGSSRSDDYMSKILITSRYRCSRLEKIILQWTLPSKWCRCRGYQRFTAISTSNIEVYNLHLINYWTK